MSKQRPQPDIFFQIKNGARPAAAMLAGMQLDLFSPLDSGALNTEELASNLGVNAGKLGALLYALVIAGLLEEENGYFSNTPETSEYFVRGKAGYIGDIQKIWYSNLLATLKTAETIRTGIPQAEYDWASLPEDELMVLYEGMSAGDESQAEWLSSQYDFSKFQTLLDAGGGSGTFAIAMTKIHPQLKATVVDLPQVTPITKQFVRDAGAGDKVQVVSADLTVDPVPGMYDVAILGSVIQTLSAHSAVQVINNVSKVVKPGGWLFIFGSGMLENSRLSPKPAVEQNLLFINTYKGGQSYTEAEYRDWLSNAGFEDFHFRFDDLTITARKRH
jgi:SAM-dependent methyltransferase